MEKKNSQLAKYFTKSSLKTFLLLNLGALMNAVGSYYFRFPNKFSIGGVAGLSVVITKFFPDISSATFLFIMNMVLVVVGFIFLGRNFGAKTAYVSVAISVFTGIFEALTPMPEPFTNQPFLELVFGVAIPSIGTSILFNIDASSGGTDIIAMIFAKYTTLNISKGTNP